MTSLRNAIFTLLLFLGATSGAAAQSVFLIPTSSVTNLDPGDVVSFTLVTNFSETPTLGGAFDVVFDPSVLDFVELTRDPEVGEPIFSRDPDILAGLLERWSVASFDLLPSHATLGAVEFSVRAPVGSGTSVFLRDTEGIGGGWVDGETFVDRLSVDYNSIELVAVPEPAVAWLLGSGLAGLALATRLKRRSRDHAGRGYMLALVFLVLGISHPALAEQYLYAGEVTSCSSSCNGIGAISGPPTASIVQGFLEIDVLPNDSFSFTDLQSHDFRFANPGELLVPDDGTNPTLANPLRIDDGLAVPRSSITVTSTLETFTTEGTTDASGELVSGRVLFEFIVPPFSTSDTWLVFNVATGVGRLCQNFAESGCSLPVNEGASIQGVFSVASDTDGDGVFDVVDNCTEVANPLQRDSDGDGHGNICDVDVDQDCIGGFSDLGIFKHAFFTADPDSDFNGNGVVDFWDLAIMRSLFFLPPGPSAVGSLCNP